ncbi:hypothetical protein GY45DRAFT_4321 [Cubamyces sp. BRFM 1775]|nr:hypothetical protein GY45DRAFT_4321 [Cubamyces sp. BRFM 1775]
MSTPTLMPTLMLSCSSCQPHMLARPPARSCPPASLPARRPCLVVYNIRASCCLSRDFGRFPPPTTHSPQSTHPLMRFRRLATLACRIFPFPSPLAIRASPFLPAPRPRSQLLTVRCLVIRALRRRAFTLYLYDPSVRCFPPLSLFHTLLILSRLCFLSLSLISAHICLPRLLILLPSFSLIVLSVTPSIATPGMYPPIHDVRCPALPHHPFSYLLTAVRGGRVRAVVL